MVNGTRECDHQEWSSAVIGRECVFYLELLKHAVHVIVFASAAHALVQLLQIVLGKRRVKPIRLQHTQTRISKSA